jgi:hypothetical protein
MASKKRTPTILASPPRRTAAAADDPGMPRIHLSPPHLDGHERELVSAGFDATGR